MKLKRRHLLATAGGVVIAGCSSDGGTDDDQPSNNDSDDDDQDSLEDEGSNETENESDGLENESESSDPDDELEDPEEDPDDEQQDSDTEEKDEPDPKVVEAREYVDAAQSTLEEATEIYVDAAGPNRNTPADIGVTGSVPQSKVTDKTGSAHNELDEAVVVIEENEIENEDLQQSLEGTRATADLIRAAVRAHYQMNQHYSLIDDMVPWIRAEDHESVRWGFDSLNTQQLTELDQAYDQARSYGDEYVRCASVHDLLTTARSASGELVSGLEKLWEIVSVDLPAAHSEYEQENYNTAMLDAEAVIEDLDSLTEGIESITLPTGADGIVSNILEQVEVRRDEAEQLRKDAAEAADN
ncbi:hypothetical protein [Natronorubrum halophilum]|uniref:hypothetical protein n=1 Tax=Natronorubrum halophilum TaxID=1702106 RepID=UPI0010C165C9|nr:hypothetical protein [Natronorubrum halophilum]